MSPRAGLPLLYADPGVSIERPAGAVIAYRAGMVLRTGDVIQTTGGYAVIDFDRALRDPRNPANLRPAYDSGDNLHPNDAGYQAMANAVDLSQFSGHASTDGISDRLSLEADDIVVVLKGPTRSIVVREKREEAAPAADKGAPQVRYRLRHVRARGGALVVPVLALCTQSGRDGHLRSELVQPRRR